MNQDEIASNLSLKFNGTKEGWLPVAEWIDENYVEREPVQKLADLVDNEGGTDDCCDKCVDALEKILFPEAKS